MEAQEGQPRCEAVNSQGQCNNRPDPGQTYCRSHGGSLTTPRHIQKRNALYQLSKTEYLVKVQEDLDRLMNHPERRRLDTEIGTARTLIERIIQSCKDDEELTMKSGEINQLLGRIDSMLKTELAIEKELKLLLPLDEIYEKFESLMSLLGDEVTTYQETVEASLITMRGKMASLEISSEDQDSLINCFPNPQIMMERLSDGWEALNATSD